MGELILEGTILRKRPIKKLILMGVDGSLIIFSYILAVIFRYYMEGNLLSEMIGIALTLKGELLLAVLVLLACQWSMKQYQSIWTLAEIEDFTLGTLSFVSGTMINLMILMLLPMCIPFLYINRNKIYIYHNTLNI